MRGLAVLILLGALLAVVSGCKAGVTDKDVESKSRQIEDATEEFLGEPIPEDEKRD